MGCVYERSFVEESIRKAQGQQLRAPFPGMNHHIRLSDLKVSSKLKREQRLAKLKHATQAQHTQEEDVVDV